jgi:hypothetical protein
LKGRTVVEKKEKSILNVRGKEERESRRKEEAVQKGNK